MADRKQFKDVPAPDPELVRLLKETGNRPVSEEELREQRVSFAFGNAPWCAVVNLGMGDVYWDCQYRTVEECVPNVIAGNRGFCNLNPYGPGPAAAAVPQKRHHKRHAGRG